MHTVDLLRHLTALGYQPVRVANLAVSAVVVELAHRAVGQRFLILLDADLDESRTSSVLASALRHLHQ